MQSSPSFGWMTIFWIKLGCCWSMWQPCRSQMKLSSWCTRESLLLGHRMKVSWMISKFSLIAGKIVTNYQAKRGAVWYRKQSGPLSLPSPNGASSTVCLRPITAHRSIGGTMCVNITIVVVQLMKCMVFFLHLIILSSNLLWKKNR